MNLIALGILAWPSLSILAWATSIPYLGHHRSSSG
jgi:hypothetical protein